MRVPDEAGLLLHQSQSETSEHSSKCLAFWSHPQPIWGTNVSLPLHFLVKPRLMIWHWLVHQECNTRMLQLTDSVSQSQLAAFSSEKYQHIKLVSCSFYNTWFNLKRSGKISVFDAKGTPTVKRISEGNYLLKSIRQALLDTLKSERLEVERSVGSPQSSK